MRFAVHKTRLKNEEKKKGSLEICSAGGTQSSARKVGSVNFARPTVETLQEVREATLAREKCRAVREDIEEKMVEQVALVRYAA